LETLRCIQLVTAMSPRRLAFRNRIGYRSCAHTRNAMVGSCSSRSSCRRLVPARSPRIRPENTAVSDARLTGGPRGERRLCGSGEQCAAGSM
jgi:hypothetical protein